MDNERILKTFQSADTEYIYGEMYGLHEGARVKRRFLKIKREELRLSAQKDCLLFQWGWPGPDINFYKFKDYGDTWAFHKEDIRDKNCEVEE